MGSTAQAAQAARLDRRWLGRTQSSRRRLHPIRSDRIRSAHSIRNRPGARRGSVWVSGVPRRSGQGLTWRTQSVCGSAATVCDRRRAQTGARARTHGHISTHTAEAHGAEAPTEVKRTDGASEDVQPIQLGLHARDGHKRIAVEDDSVAHRGPTRHTAYIPSRIDRREARHGIPHGTASHTASDRNRMVLTRHDTAWYPIRQGIGGNRLYATNVRWRGCYGSAPTILGTLPSAIHPIKRQDDVPRRSDRSADVAVHPGTEG